MRERPNFQTPESLAFRERMKNQVWDNEPGKPSLSEEQIEDIADAFVKEQQKGKK
ncbi:hypothetical protein [Candidatus Sulfurimonas baltica]|uniref:Uncharacterized protein n=1 Tax=Candidatus Sulfurimonas baltica TaxID=2740404 RepID=A0A7S7LTB9_9BACT|nr:hypothetical protein [Candidatus Sulfurimonas baltica]QOY50947.1 hypothetical protein HUE88_07260 [Candidatus Sulfurimonas baltica]